jgi:hypothetical protein
VTEADDRTRILLSAIDNALRNGSYMTGANVAFNYLCDELGVERDSLPPFNPRWAAAELEAQLQRAVVTARRAGHQALTPGETT